MVKKFDENTEQDILRMYAEGRTQKDIAASIGTYNTSIRRVLLRHNVPIISNSIRQARVKSNPFVNSKEPTVHYWLGYISADGCIHKGNSINLSTNLDPDILSKYAEFIGHGVEVRSYLNKKYQTLEYSCGFACKEAVLFLEELGITKSKSKTLCWKGEFSPDFVRGYFDGNGSVSQDITISTGSLTFAEQLEVYLSKYTSKTPITKHNNRSCYIINISRRKAEYFYHFLYDDASLFLNRKREKFSSFLAERSGR